MPTARPSRRPHRLTLVDLAFGLLAAGTAGGMAPRALTTPDAAQASPSATTATPANDTMLLTEDELYATVVDVAREDSSASLYYVAGNGSWYHADANGTIGPLAPRGAAVPNVDGARADIPAAERPVYVWKVTHPCGTTVYDASTGRVIAPMPMFGCGGPTHVTDEPVRTVNPSGTETDVVDQTAVGVSTPGFGTGAAVTAILGYLGYRGRG